MAARARKIGLLVAAALVGAAVHAAPVATLSPKETRRKLVAEADSYLGVRYRYGGVDRSGLDCSGLVFLVVRGVTGASLPRTAREQYSWAEPVVRSQLQSGDLVFFNTTGRYSHVGVYLGDGTFIHAASDGPKTGVIISSLDEDYWARAYAGGGRIVAPANFLGLRFALGGGPTGWAGVDGSLLRGGAVQAALSYEGLGFVSPGLELRPEWDGSLGVFRVSSVLSVGIGKEWRLFAGPALVFGDPVLEDGAKRDYAPAGGWLATGGVCWTPATFNVRGVLVSPYLDIAWQRYEPEASEKDDFGADATANFRASVGVRLSWDF